MSSKDAVLAREEAKKPKPPERKTKKPKAEPVPDLLAAEFDRAFEEPRGES
jgi:hypothetical protein